MRIKTFSEYEKDFIKTGRLRGMFYTPSKVTRPKLKRAYEKYIKLFDKKKPSKKTEKMIKKDKSAKENCMERAGGKCEVWPLLTGEEKAQIRPLLHGIYAKLDPMHIVGRANKKLREDPENIVIASRLIHSRIDNYIDPVTGEKMPKDERERWLIRIVGGERWQYLQRKKNEKI